MPLKNNGNSTFIYAIYMDEFAIISGLRKMIYLILSIFDINRKMPVYQPHSTDLRPDFVAGQLHRAFRPTTLVKKITD